MNASTGFIANLKRAAKSEHAGCASASASVPVLARFAALRALGAGGETQEVAVVRAVALGVVERDTLAALEVAAAWGYIERDAALVDALDRIAATTYRLAA